MRGRHLYLSYPPATSDRSQPLPDGPLGDLPYRQRSRHGVLAPVQAAGDLSAPQSTAPRTGAPAGPTQAEVSSQAARGLRRLGGSHPRECIHDPREPAGDGCSLNTP